MEYRPLGRTGVQVSALCLGCMTFGGATPRDEAYRMLDRALDAGINFLDTANVYNRGDSEETVGQALKHNGRRKQVVLASKFSGRMADDDPNALGNSRRHLIAQCEASLKRLQTDYLDLYQVHRPASGTPIDETLRALDDLVRAGKVRYIGTTTFAAWQVVEALWASKELGLNRFVTEQPPYNLLDRRVERELAPMAQTFGIAINPWSPIAGGLLSGKYRRGQPAPEGSRYAEPNPAYQRRLVDRVFDALDGVEALAQAKDCSMVQFSMAWLLGQPGVTSPVIGPRTMEQLGEYLGTLDVVITDADRQQVDRLVPRGDMATAFYQADFGPHPYRAW